MKTRRIHFERRIKLLAFGAGLPGSSVAIILLWTGDFSPKTQWTLTAFILLLWLGFGASLHENVVFPLRTFSNLLAALREGDFSLRARTDDPDDALGEVAMQINAMAKTLREQRLSALEATALLRKVMAEIDVAVFAFDSEERLRLINRAGERLLARTSERILHRSAHEIGLSEYLSDDAPAVVRAAFPGGAGIWGTKRTEFREGGLSHTLLVISNLTSPLREEELVAWQRLVRVLGHEINNSLTPVKSISQSLADLLARDPLPEDWREDARSGLSAIASRSEALSRFTRSYARLARLPRPERAPVKVADLVMHVAQLETRMAVIVRAGPDVTIRADRDQLEQLLINVVRNAVDASMERNSASGEVTVTWSLAANALELLVQDDGPGMANLSNVFVPFFTTKPQGSGIGLVLSRQIAEAHGGDLTLSNREDGGGCVARLWLPL